MAGSIVKVLDTDPSKCSSTLEAASLYELFSIDQAVKVDQFLKRIDETGIAIDWDFHLPTSSSCQLVFMSGAKYNGRLYATIQPPAHLDNAPCELNEPNSADQNKYLSAIVSASGVSSRTRSVEFLSELSKVNSELVNSQRELSLSKAMLEKVLETERGRSQQLASFYKAASEVVGATGIDSIVNTIVGAICEASGFGVEGAAIYLAQPDGRFVAQKSSFDNPKILEFVSNVSQEMIVSFSRMTPTLYEACRDSNKAIEALLYQLGVSSGLFVPLRSSRSKLGMVIVLFAEEAESTDEKVQLIEAFSAMAATAIHSEHMKEEMEALATTDGLTGLLNRRAFLSSLAGELKRAERRGQPLSVMIADVDHFKKVNDKYGHAAGDIVLTSLAMAIHEDVRTEDLVCRYGGEEFALALPDTPLDSALIVAERLRWHVSKTCVFYGDISIPLAISIGVYQVEPGTGIEQALLQADRALYEAKRAGRNRVVGSSATVSEQSKTL